MSGLSGLPAPSSLLLSLFLCETIFFLLFFKVNLPILAFISLLLSYCDMHILKVLSLSIQDNPTDFINILEIYSW